MSSHTEAGYNKTIPKDQGTLVGNWNEERSMREFTGVGRTIMREHIPKRCGNTEVPIVNDKKFDNTYDRIYGKRTYTQLNTEAQIIGAGKNPANDLPKLGRKTLRAEEEIMQQVKDQMDASDRVEDLKREQRHFDTTMCSDYVQKDMQ